MLYRPLPGVIYEGNECCIDLSQVLFMKVMNAV